MKSLRTRGQYFYCLFYLKYAKERLTCSLPISSIQTMSDITCKVEIENFTQPSLHYFTSPMNCLTVTWIRRRYLLFFFWTCPKAFDSIRHDLMLRKLRKSGVSEFACAWFESYLSQRKQVVKYLIPYPLRLGYRRDPSWARCCLHCM